MPVRVDLANDSTWQDALNFHGKVDQPGFVAFGADQSLPPDNIPPVDNGQMSSAIANALDAIRLQTESVQDAMTQCNKTVNQTLVGWQ